MSQTRTVAVRPPQGHEVWLACGTCGKVTCHRTLTLVATSDESPDGDIQVWDDYLTVQCGGCRTVSFCVQSSCSEGLEWNPRTEQEELSVTNRVYPNRIAGRSELEHSQLLPYATYRIYEETRTAISNDQPVLAGIGIRAIVETICKERAAKGGNLKEQIDDLAAAGIITEDGAQILHSLRFMGNSAAHEVKAHSQDELIIALDVAEYSLKGVYILPKLAEKLPKK
ncbi:MAG: DUF4145 domain-containing protein [Nitrosomonas sp.]|nr:DUF4145 domain-containing protein [Nitrosomonas sp.]